MKQRSILALVAAAALLAAAGAAQAESTYGYGSAGTGTVTATARLNISVVVPKVVVLRVGDAGGTVNTLTYAARVSIPNTPTLVDGATPNVSNSSVAVTWDGNAPTVSVPSTTATAAAYAWTNGSNVNVNCSATAFTGSGPTLANITAAAGVGNNLPHPTGNLSACVATPNLTAGTLHTGTWTYTLDATNAATWAPGTYSTVVTYTATGT